MALGLYHDAECQRPTTDVEAVAPQSAIKEIKNLLGSNYKIIEVQALKDAYAN